MGDFPIETPPTGLQLLDVADGIKWFRLPLPMRLDHVNIYLIEDGDGWAVVDAGIFNPASVSIWNELLAGPLSGMTLTRLIVTHHHPDHVGMAGWLCERARIPLLISHSAYMLSQNILLNPDSMGSRIYRDFYTRRGLSEETADLVGTNGHSYCKDVSTLPTQFLRLVSGDAIQIGKRRLRVLTCDGHAPEQALLYDADENILFAGDQVMLNISPNVSTWATEPESDILSHYLRSLRFLMNNIPDGALILPGHHMPFYGLADRCAELIAHHEERCDLIVNACAESPKCVGELVPVLFQRTFDPFQLGFAFGETLAHANRLLRRGRLKQIVCEDSQLIKYDA